jgi:YHS domain-containing protein
MMNSTPEDQDRHESGGKPNLFRTDPVCGAPVDPEHAAATADYGHATYFFDSDSCTQQFEHAPQLYTRTVEEGRQ